MIVYLLVKGFNAIIFAIISIIPTFETPVWLATQLPDIVYRIASFNWYLPVYETVGVVVFLIAFTLRLENYKSNIISCPDKFKFLISTHVRLYVARGKGLICIFY